MRWSLRRLCTRYLWTWVNDVWPAHTRVVVFGPWHTHLSNKFRRTRFCVRRSGPSSVAARTSFWGARWPSRSHNSPRLLWRRLISSRSGILQPPWSAWRLAETRSALAQQKKSPSRGRWPCSSSASPRYIAFSDICGSALVATSCGSALVATLAELYQPFDVNDNLSIPVLSVLTLNPFLARISSVPPAR